MQTKAKYIQKVLLITLSLNWFVAVAKFIFGKSIGSTSMVADSLHSFSDSASNIMGLIGIWIAYLPQDKGHPYGHRKYETLASTGIALLLFLACFNIISMSLKRFLHPAAPDINIASIAVMLVTIIINLGVMNYERSQGERLQSDVLVNDSMHTRADIFTSISVLFSFLAVKMGILILDPLIALLISGFIAKVGIRIFSQSAKVLCDSSVIDAKRIQDICSRIPGVIKSHKIRTRGRPDDVHADLHVLIDKRTKFAAAHDLSSVIEQEIRKVIPAITDVVVHMEPVDGHKE